LSSGRDQRFDHDLSIGHEFRLGQELVQSDVGRLTGYWSGAYTYWEGDKTSSNNSLSFSPVFVYEFAGQSSSRMLRRALAWRCSPTPSKTTTSAAFQFEDRIGFGLRFAGGHEVGFVPRTIPTPG
jgi:lipid A 3-O-deacylase